MKCINCNKETNNPKFCSRNCAAIYNNKYSPKRKVEGSCITCKKPIRTSKKYCSLECRGKISWDTITIAEAISQAKSSFDKYLKIRTRLRVSYPKTGVCRFCGYNKHTELSHIKSISSFPVTALVAEVNSPNNILELCPNCHWEFDNGLLTIDASASP